MSQYRCPTCGIRMGIMTDQEGRRWYYCPMCLTQLPVESDRFIGQYSKQEDDGSL